MAHSRRHAQYWQQFLLPGERAIHTFGISGAYIIFFWLLPFIAVLLMALAVAFLNPILGVLILIPALSLFLPIFYQLYFVHYAITDQRIMEREGVLHKRFVTVDLPSITDVLIHEPFLERFITHTGTILVNTAGSPGSELKYRHVKRPASVRQDIFRHLQEITAKRIQPPPQPQQPS
jgi:uncharacterized membrane protein YdbT with pleckstrin-like domain